MKLFRLSILAIVASVIASCTPVPVVFADFDASALDQSLFTVMSVNSTTIGEAAGLDATKTTTFGGQDLIRGIFEQVAKSNIIEIVGTYHSKDRHHNDVVLSGKVIIPTGVPIKRYVLLSHYTISADRQSPSRRFPLESVLSNLGYVFVVPDYEGFGVTASHQHPYLCMEQTATNVADMFKAVRKMLEGSKYAPEFEDIFLMGYSQGAATTMATLSRIEVLDEPIKVRAALVGGGPYDLSYTYQGYITSNSCNFPYALLMVAQGMAMSGDLDCNPADLMTPEVAVHFDDWVNSKKYSMTDINNAIGTKQTDKILGPQLMDPTTDIAASFYKELNKNSITLFAWTPKAPVYMFHSINDDVVPFENATMARSKWADGNIQYNFGYYGAHGAALTRFIFTVRTFLEEGKW